MGGSLGRLKSDQQKIINLVVCIIDTDKPEILKDKEVPLKKQTCFAVTEKIKKKQTEEELEKFIKTLGQEIFKIEF